MSDEWIKALADRRRVKFTNQGTGREGVSDRSGRRDKVVYSIVLSNAKNPLSREEVENHFEDELSKVSPNPKLSLLRASRQRQER
jgi:hypothetical protein